MKYYIAGPMTGYPQENMAAFDAAALYYRNQGIDVSNPADLQHKLSNIPLTEEMRRDIIMYCVYELCQGCTHIVLLPGWEQSKGAAVEVAVARFLGLTEIIHAEEPLHV